MNTEGRAQSETMGFVLIIGVVLVGAALVAVIGALALGQTEGSLSEDRAETVLTQLDSKAGMVALGESSTQRVSLGSGATDEFSLEPDSGTLRITIVNRTSEEVEWTEEFTLGAVVWDDGDTRIAYQGGGVWRGDANGGQMISPPEFHFRGATLTLPIVTVDGDRVLSTDAMISHESVETIFPRDDVANPLEEHEVVVSITSEFYRGWAEYMQTRTEGEVSVNAGNEQTNIELISRIGDTFIRGAVAGQTADGSLTFQGNPSHPCGGNTYFDSYDSTEGEYCDQFDSTELRPGGELIFGGDITGDSSAGQVQGDFVSGGDVIIHQNQDMHGDIRLVGECVEEGSNSCTSAQESAENSNNPVPDPDGYEIIQIDDVETEPALDRVIDQVTTEARNELDETTFTNGDEIESGVYYTEEIDITGNLLFNTTEGDISIIVEEGIRLNGANVEIHGEGDVDIFVGGDDSATYDLQMDSSTVWAPNNDATKLTILGDSDFTSEMDDGEFTGVVYAPGDEDSDALFRLIGGGNVYGAIVTGDMEIGGTGGAGGGAGGTVHYDRALGNQIVVPPDFGITRLTYLHISQNEISFTN